MRLQQNKLQSAKAAIHGLQALLIFVAGCLTLAVMTKTGGHAGETNFYFALCFITMPAIIYQVMVPMWSRAWRLNNVWAFAAIDLLCAILWFAASVAVAVWNARGIAQGKTTTSPDSNTLTARANDHDGKDGTCDSFAYGSATKCNVSKTTVGLGIVVFLLFCITAAMAVQAIRRHRQTSALPNTNIPHTEQSSAFEHGDGGKDIWEPSTDDLDTGVDHRLADGEDAGDVSHGLLRGARRDQSSDSSSHVNTEGLAHPGQRAPSWHASEQLTNAPNYEDSYAPSALSPSGFASPNGTLRFPEANYNALR